MKRLTRREQIRVASVRAAEHRGRLSHREAEQILGPLAERDRLDREHPLRDFAAALVNAFVMRPAVLDGWPRRFHLWRLR